jgi:hypothetical protein
MLLGSSRLPTQCGQASALRPGVECTGTERMSAVFELERK